MLFSNITFPEVNHSAWFCQKDSLYYLYQGRMDKILSRKDNWSLLNFKTNLLSFANFWQMGKWQFCLAPQRLNKWNTLGSLTSSCDWINVTLLIIVLEYGLWVSAWYTLPSCTHRFIQTLTPHNCNSHQD